MRAGDLDPSMVRGVSCVAANRLTSVTDADRDEMISVGMEAVCRKAQFYDPEKMALKRWAYIVAYQATVDYIRCHSRWAHGKVRTGNPGRPYRLAWRLQSIHREKNAKDRVEDAEDFEAENLEDPVGQFANQVIDHLGILQALEHVTDREREIIMLTHWGGYTLQQIGDQQGVSESRICQILGRAHRKMAEAMAR